MPVHPPPRRSSRKRKQSAVESDTKTQASTTQAKRTQVQPSRGSRATTLKKARRAKAKETAHKQAKRKAAGSSVVYVAKVAHSDQFGEHEETLGRYASKAACAKVVREHIENVYGTELLDQYDIEDKGNGFVTVDAHGWEGESMHVYMVMHHIQA